MTAQDFQLPCRGAAGRMGQMIQTVLAEQNITLKAATEDKSSDKIGTKMMGVTVSDDSAALGQGPGCVIVDFTRPEVTMAHLAIARSTATPMVIGTTGLSASDEQKIAEAASDIPVVYCANTSVGVTLLSRIVSDVARALSDDWDIEIVETHHHHKIDAPSGTALALGHAAAKGRVFRWMRCVIADVMARQVPARKVISALRYCVAAMWQESIRSAFSASRNVSRLPTGQLAGLSLPEAL